MTDENIQSEAEATDADKSKMAKATAGISTFTILGFLTGPVTKMIMAPLFGTGPVNNAFNYAYRLVQDVFRNWEKLIRPTFLPVLAQERDRVGEDDSWRFASSLINLQIVLLAPITLALIVFARPVVGVLTTFQGETLDNAIEYLRILAPTVMFLSLAVTGYMLLNSYKRFNLAAFGDHIFVKILPLTAMVGFYAFSVVYKEATGTSIGNPAQVALYALLVGTTSGALAKLLLYAWGLRRPLKRYRLNLVLRSRAMKSMGLLMLPLSVGVGVAFLRNRGEDLLLSAVLNGDAMTIVPYARAPVDIPVQIFPVALAIAIFPFISDYFARKQHEELFNILGKGIRIIFLGLLPLTVGLFLLAHPLVDVVFGRGKFNPQDVDRTAITMQYHALAYVFLGLEVLLLQFFYAARETWSPACTGIITSLLQLNILAGILMLRPDGVQAFTQAFTLSKALKAAVLLVLLARVYPHGRLWGAMLRRTLPSLAKLLAITAVMGVAVWFLDRGLAARLPSSHTLKGLLRLAICGGTGAMIYAAGVHLLRIEEWRQALDFLKTKLSKQ